MPNVRSYPRTSDLLHLGDFNVFADESSDSLIFYGYRNDKPVTRSCKTSEEAERQLGRYIRKELDKKIKSLQEALADAKSTRLEIQARARGNPNWLAE